MLAGCWGGATDMSRVVVGLFHFDKKNGLLSWKDARVTAPPLLPIKSEVVGSERHLMNQSYTLT